MKTSTLIPNSPPTPIKALEKIVLFIFNQLKIFADDETARYTIQWMDCNFATSPLPVQVFVAMTPSFEFE